MVTIKQVDELAEHIIDECCLLTEQRHEIADAIQAWLEDKGLLKQ